MKKMNFKIYVRNSKLSRINKMNFFKILMAPQKSKLGDIKNKISPLMDIFAKCSLIYLKAKFMSQFFYSILIIFNF